MMITLPKAVRAIKNNRSATLLGKNVVLAFNHLGTEHLLALLRRQNLD